MNEQIIRQTRNWIEKVVIGNNFCPFAARELVRERIRYVVCEQKTPVEYLEVLMKEFQELTENEAVETTLIIFPNDFKDFNHFWSFVEMTQQFLVDWGYEGIYQLANFHPEYIFARAAKDDPANYTNRSPYPMLHILREASVEKAIANYPDAENIPNRNITHARKEGLRRMMQALKDCT